MVELENLTSLSPSVIVENPASAFERFVRETATKFDRASGNGGKFGGGLVALDGEWYRDQVTAALQVNPLLAWTPIVSILPPYTSSPNPEIYLSSDQDAENVPSPPRRRFLKLLAGVSAGIALSPWISACSGATDEAQKPRNLKEEILAFTWENVSNDEKRRVFISQLADKYLELTNSDRLSKEEMVNNVSFLNSRDEFVEAVHAVDPDFQPSENQWGHTHYKSRKVFLDLETLKAQSMSQIPSEKSAGLALIDALWHEWGHLDIKENYQGELLNRSDMRFTRPDGTTEELRYYRGGAAYTDSYYGFIRFDEVLLETITVRRMMEDLSLEGVLSAKDYYFSGVDFFIQLTQAVGITINELYQYHATSDFEGLAKRIGEKLPGEQDALTKGVYLFIGIHQADPAFINDSGVCNLLVRQNDLIHICP